MVIDNACSIYLNVALKVTASDFFFHVHVFNSALYEYRDMSANNGAQLLPREFQLIVKIPDFQILLSCCQSETQASFIYHLQSSCVHNQNGF